MLRIRHQTGERSIGSVAAVAPFELQSRTMKLKFQFIRTFRTELFFSSPRLESFDVARFFLEIRMPGTALMYNSNPAAPWGSWTRHRMRAVHRFVGIHQEEAAMQIRQAIG